MKKVLSLLLVTVMVLGVLAIGVNAYEKTPALTQTGNGNVSVEAHYFGGTVDFDYLYGSMTAKPDKKTYYDTERVKDGDSSMGYIKIDGIMDEGEWGDPIATISSKYAASNKNLKGVYMKGDRNDAFETPSAENTYYYSEPIGWASAGTNAPEAGLEYNLYLMWDEDYFYVAATLHDPDGPKQVYSGASIWDGDCFQLRVDTRGVNSSTPDGVFDATQKRVEYAEDGTRYEYYPTPWADTSYNAGGTVANKDSVNNLMFSYTASGGGYTECYDAALRYNPTEVEYNVIGDDGEITTATRTVWSGASVADDTEIEAYMDDFCYAVARFDNWGTAAVRNDTAVYEIAIPWVVLQAEGTEYSPVAGDVLGMSAVLFDGTKINGPAGGAPDGFVAWLGWGCGICGSQITNDPQTTGGNNAVVLSSTSYKDYDGCEHNFAAATCLAPETCTICGYQRGYASGHSNVYSDTVLPTKSKAGSVTATCTVCGLVDVGTIDYDDNKSYASFTENSATIPDAFSDGYKTNWFDMTDKDVENTGVDKKMLFTAEGVSKNSLDKDTFGYSVIDAATRGEGLYYVDGSPATLSDSIDYGSQTGTYFFSGVIEGTDAKNYKEYSYNAELYFPTLTDYIGTGVGHSTSIVNQFGGKNSIEYFAGLFVTEDSQYVFAIGKEGLIGYYNTGDSNDKTVAEIAEQALAYKVVDASVVATGEWHQWNFLFDSDNGIAALFWDGELMVSAYDYHMTATNGTIFTIMRRFNIPYYEKNIQIASLGYAVENYNLKTTEGGDAEEYTLTVDGVAESYAAGETVTVSAAAFKAATGERFVAWNGDVDVLSANEAEVTFTMPANDVTLTSVYVKVGDANGDGKITAADANYISQIIVGSLASVPAADINADTKVSATDSNLLAKMITGTYAPIK